MQRARSSTSPEGLTGGNDSRGSTQGGFVTRFLIGSRRSAGSIRDRGSAAISGDPPIGYPGYGGTREVTPLLAEDDDGTGVNFLKHKWMAFHEGVGGEPCLQLYTSPPEQPSGDARSMPTGGGETKKKGETWDDALTLEGYVEKLLNEGKQSKSPEFRSLMSVFGEARIRKLARAVLDRKTDPAPDPGMKCK